LYRLWNFTNQDINKHTFSAKKRITHTLYIIIFNAAKKEQRKQSFTPQIIGFQTSDKTQNTTESNSFHTEPIRIRKVNAITSMTQTESREMRSKTRVDPHAKI